MKRARPNPLGSLEAAMYAPSDVSNLDAIEARWSRFSELADAAYEAGLADEGDLLSEAADAAAQEWEYAYAALQELEESEASEGGMLEELAAAYEERRLAKSGAIRGSGLESDADLAERVKGILDSYGQLDESFADDREALMAAAYEAWLSKTKLRRRLKASSERRARPNPRPPAKPLHVVIAEAYNWFAVIGWLGNAKAGYVDCHPVKPRDEKWRGHEIRALLGGLPGWYVSNAFLAGEKFRHKGYGTQLYCVAFAEAVRQSGGPVVVGSAQAMTMSPTSMTGTSKEAAAVWRRLREEGKYPFHPTLDALVFTPDDIEPWMLPAKRFDQWHRGKLR